MAKNGEDLIVYQEWQENTGTTVAENQNNTNGSDGTINMWPLNANLNYYQYGDDSNPAQQWQKGGMNEKYTWEWVKTSNLEYDPNITRADLDPNYLYWENARQQNRKEAGYIARRNDMIASALYNEWLTSKDDVANFLSQQNEWMNSTEADRMNTIESVWKRLWQIQPEREKPDLSKAEEIVQDTSGKIYWKTTAEEWNPREWINTLADANSVFKSMQEWQVRDLQDFVSMDISDIATCIVEWVTTWTEQTWRDAQKYYPEFIAEVNAEVKKKRGQENITNISMWGKMDLTNQLTASENNVTTGMNTYVNKTASGSWAWTLATNLNNALADSEIVSWAKEQMEVYKRKIVEIQQAAEDLPALAQQSFKWDASQQMVNAFINNRMQQLNKELEKYQNLYNASLDEAKLEISQQQWREEMNYKWSSLQADQNYKDVNLELAQKELAYNIQKASISNWQWNDDGSYSYVDINWEMHTLSAEDAKKALNNDLYNYATEYIDTWSKKIETAKAKWQKVTWWQCEAFTDNFARQYFWTEMVGNWHKWTTAEEKAAYATEALPQRGYIAVWDYWIKQKDWVNYWHTWIVIDYDPKTWYFTTIESNVDWLWHVEIKTHSINDAKLQGFRDPSEWENVKNGWSNLQWWFEFYDTPMREIFMDAANWANDKTADERKDIKIAEQSYATLYELMNEWLVDTFVGIRADQSEKDWEKFIWTLQNESFTDSDGNVMFDAMTNYIMKNLNHWEELAYMLTRLRRLVEIKLRRESWAAINVSEWNGNFTNYLPWANQGSEYTYKKLRALEIDTVPSLLPTEYRDKYIPVFTSYEDYIKSRKAADEAEIKELTDIAYAEQL